MPTNKLGRARVTRRRLKKTNDGFPDAHTARSSGKCSGGSESDHACKNEAVAGFKLSQIAEAPGEKGYYLQLSWGQERYTSMKNLVEVKGVTVPAPVVCS